ncbi:DNA polymerase III beta subunit [Tsukamurella phage TIN2]|uniref:DNA polymerase III beta subunit n=1 Tax=Tsukamurella phage TIN2 TaxID=1636545 RepID=A0A0K0N5Q3_9CAUD|nr:DNA polymerase processivity factor [Tsukamurella phage TIN2]AKJ71737.1 DNA polymerase III beta subunit [Tsukamurella phage TIN2]
MAATVEFNNAALADAVKRANIIAPTRGRELDKFKGFIIDLYPGEEYVTLRVTNGEVFYTEYLYPNELEVPVATSWRVASNSTHGIVSNLAASGSVKLKEEGGKIRITSGRMKATTPLIKSGDYPDPDQFMFEPEGMFNLKGFGTRLDLVGWSTSSDGLPPRCGVYMDEGHLCATNGKTLVRVPNEFKFADGRNNIVLPYQLIGPVLRSLEEIQMGVIGDNLVIAPTEDIFIKCSLFEPRFDPVNRIMEKEMPAAISFSKEDVISTLSRVSKIGASDRQIGLDVYIGGESMTLSVKDRDSAEEIEETILLISGGDHDIVKFMFSVEYFTDIITKAPGRELVMEYNPEKTVSMVKFLGDDGYEGVVMPRAEIAKSRGDEDGS